MSYEDVLEITARRKKTVIQVDLRCWCLEAERAAVEGQLEVWTGFLKGGTGK